MSRRRAAEKREILPDARYGSVTVAKLMSCLMLHGKKSAAETIVYGALEHMQTVVRGARGNAVAMLEEALTNVRPHLEVRSRRVGGATYQVPVEVRPTRALALSLRWIIGSARKRSEHTMDKRLAGELLDALNNRGTAVKKREDTHRMAEANKAFSHYRW
ncbi:MAG: 30S ribosomal protein S7 [Alphaproteobacteria bacterium]|nr:MAG: 30S ribosomal protein S7 [Alphaproteobacteria bacterium]